MIPPISGIQAIAAATFGGKSIEDGSPLGLAAGLGTGGGVGSVESGIRLLTKTGGCLCQANLGLDFAFAGETKTIPCRRRRRDHDRNSQQPAFLPSDYWVELARSRGRTHRWQDSWPALRNCFRHKCRAAFRRSRHEKFSFCRISAGLDYSSGRREIENVGPSQRNL